MLMRSFLFVVVVMGYPLLVMVIALTKIIMIVAAQLCYNSRVTGRGIGKNRFALF